MPLKLRAYVKLSMNFVGFFSSFILPYIRALFSPVGIDLKSHYYYVNNSKCVVLGNGPSLKNDLVNILKNVENTDFITVNHFSESEHFKIIKPSIHVLLDLYFWAKETHADLKKKRDLFFESLKLVDWDLEIFVPSTADIDFLCNNIKNPKIKIIPFKIVQIEGVDFRMARYFINRKFFGPPACNVLVYAIYIALNAKYKEVNVFGADMSFHTDVIVDQQSNEVKIKYTHFYGDTEYQNLYHNPERIIPVSMFELMKLTASTFYGHELLSMYAKERKQQLFNRSSYSMIDSYKRS